MSTATKTLPAAGTYTIDASHSSLEAVARHLMVTKVRGRFSGLTGTVEIADDVTASRVDVEIDAKTIDTNERQRDEHLRGADFLDVDNFPTIRFVSTGITALGDDRYAIAGELTVRDVTREVTLDATYFGLAQDPWGNTRVALTAETELDREDFGITWNQALETGGVLVSRKIKVELDVQLLQA